MSQVITATYSDGMFKPDIQLNLSPGTRVRPPWNPWSVHPKK
jgi:predicted DNA-binding antitoxin AbrB/MazE fold protein